MTTAAQLARVTQNWSAIAGETVQIEIVSGAFYGFCSELGALRLFHNYRIVDGRAKADFSIARNTWFFRLETRT